MIPKELEEIIEKEGLRKETIEKIYEETKQTFGSMFPDDMSEDEKNEKILNMVKAKILRNTTIYKKPVEYDVLVVDATGIEKNKRGNEYTYGQAFAFVKVKDKWCPARINFYDKIAGYIETVEPMKMYKMGLVPKNLDGICNFTGVEGEIPREVSFEGDIKQKIIELAKAHFKKSDLVKARIEISAGIEDTNNISSHYNDLKIIEATIVRPSFGTNKETGDKYGSYNVTVDGMNIFNEASEDKPFRVFATYRQVRYQEPSMIYIIGRVSKYKKDVVINADAIIPIAAIPIQKLGDDGGYSESIPDLTTTTNDIEEY